MHRFRTNGEEKSGGQLVNRSLSSKWSLKFSECVCVIIEVLLLYLWLHDCFHVCSLVQMACKTLLSTMFLMIRRRRIVGLRSSTLTVTRRRRWQRNDLPLAVCLAATSLLTGPTRSRNQMRKPCQRHVISFDSLCPVSTILLPFFLCHFAVPVSHCRFRTLLPLLLPLRIFLLFTAVMEQNFLT